MRAVVKDTELVLILAVTFWLAPAFILVIIADNKGRSWHFAW